MNAEKYIAEMKSVMDEFSQTYGNATLLSALMRAEDEDYGMIRCSELKDIIRFLEGLIEVLQENGEEELERYLSGAS